MTRNHHHAVGILFDETLLSQKLAGCAPAAAPTRTARTVSAGDIDETQLRRRLAQSAAQIMEVPHDWLVVNRKALQAKFAQLRAQGLFAGDPEWYQYQRFVAKSWQLYLEDHPEENPEQRSFAAQRNAQSETDEPPTRNCYECGTPVLIANSEGRDLETMGGGELEYFECPKCGAQYSLVLDGESTMCQETGPGGRKYNSVRRVAGTYGSADDYLNDLNSGEDYKYKWLRNAFREALSLNPSARLSDVLRLMVRNEVLNAGLGERMLTPGTPDAAIAQQVWTDAKQPGRTAGQATGEARRLCDHCGHPFREADMVRFFVNTTDIKKPQDQYICKACNEKEFPHFWKQRDPRFRKSIHTAQSEFDGPSHYHPPRRPEKEPSPRDIDDDEIEMWVANDEGLYNWMHEWSNLDPRAADPPDDGSDEANDWDGDMAGFIHHNRVELQRRIFDTLHGDRPSQGYGDPRNLMGRKTAPNLGTFAEAVLKLPTP